MRILITLIATLALALVGAACSKNEGDKEGGEASSSGSGGETTSGAGASGDDEEPEETSGGGGEEGSEAEVGPAAPEDLAKFIEDLEGDGPLKATIETSMGEFNCELFEEKAPLTVANFVGLATGELPWKDPKSGEVQERPLYDGLKFHRVIPEFMIQGGDPLGNGTGGPGFTFDQEVSKELRHDKPGILSMARKGHDPHSQGSQFFVMEAPRPSLDGKYNVFGHCKDAAALVKKIARVETEIPGDDRRCQSRRAPPGCDKPADDVTIDRVVIHRGEN